MEKSNRRCHPQEEPGGERETRAEPTRPSGKHTQESAQALRCHEVALHMEIRQSQVPPSSKRAGRDRPTQTEERIPLDQEDWLAVMKIFPENQGPDTKFLPLAVEAPMLGGGSWWDRRPFSLRRQHVQAWEANGAFS